MRAGKVTFDRPAAFFVLDAFGKTVDEENYLVEKANRNQRVMTPQGVEVRLGQFAGVRKGSEIYVTSDMASLIEAADAMR